MKKGDCPPFVFVVQLQFPGIERHFGYVCYFAPEDVNMFEVRPGRADKSELYRIGRDLSHRL